MNDKTKTLLEKLPFDQAFKDELLVSYDSLTQEQQLEVIDLIWLTYADLYEIKLEENLSLALANDGDGHTVEDFYTRVHEKTDNDMKNLASEAVDEADLEAARVAMERIIKEMKAAKMPLKVD